MILFYSFGLISYVNYQMSGTVYSLLFYYFLWDFILALINVSVVRLIWEKSSFYFDVLLKCSLRSVRENCCVIQMILVVMTLLGVVSSLLFVVSERGLQLTLTSLSVTTENFILVQLGCL